MRIVVVNQVTLGAVLALDRICARGVLMDSAGMMIEHGGSSGSLLLCRKKEPSSRPAFLPQVVSFLLGIARIWKAHLLPIDRYRHVIVVVACAIGMSQARRSEDTDCCELVDVAVTTQADFVRRDHAALLTHNVLLGAGVGEQDVLAEQMSTAGLVQALRAKKMILL